MRNAPFENRFDPDSYSYPVTKVGFQSQNIKGPPIPRRGFEDDEDDCCSGPGCWIEPPKDFLPVSYCQENSMHGLKYVAQEGRHLTERICWVIAFLIGVGAAVYLINGVWENYRKNPVIVSFQPVETDINEIPFPAVTICNMNVFSKKLYEELRSKYRDASLKDSERARARMDLQFIKSICGTSKSFSKTFDFAAARGNVNFEDKQNFLNRTDTTLDLFSLLIEKTVPCDELIRLCLWSEEPRNCSELFKPVVTEYGKCCTFNILPLQLLLSQNTKTRYNDDAGTESRRTGGPITPRWSKMEVAEWQKWDYTKGGFLLEPFHTRPLRQSRAGIPFGLSILLDGNTDEYFCPSTDSQGFRLVLHTALEMPPVVDWGVAIGLGKEIFMELSPDMTVAAPQVFDFPYEKRNCFFQSEKTLEFYNAYTTSNCLSECIANLTAANCGCTLFHMPRRASTRVCSSTEGSPDDLCSRETRKNLTKNYRRSCKLCDSLCTDIFYHFVFTQADLQPSNLLWQDPEDPNPVPEWASHKMSIVHLYFALDSFVPKVRNELYATVDLIANTGGLLGLCLGFSALSAVEFVYFFTLRYFWQTVRRRTIGRRIAHKFIDALNKLKMRQRLGYSDSFEGREGDSSAGSNNNNHRNTIIEMDKTILPIYPAYLHPTVNSRPKSKSKTSNSKFPANSKNIVDPGRSTLTNDPRTTFRQPYSMYDYQLAFQR